MQTTRLVVLVAFSVAMTACIPNRYWAKPGANDADFQRDKYVCWQQAAAMYPVNIVQQVTDPGRAPTETTNCYAIGYSVQCQSQQTSRGRPPTVESVDVNVRNRENAAEQCMYSNGWRIMTK
jgi:hypothetical protein